MHISHLMTGLLVVAWATVDAALAATAAGGLRWPAIPGVIALGVAFAQASLLCAWLVWGRGNIVVRAGLALAGLYCLAHLVAVGVVAAEQRPVWFAAQLIFAGVTVPAMLASRVFYFRLTTAPVSQAASASKGRNGFRSRQFTIWGLLSTMTAVGLLLGAARMTNVVTKDLLAGGLFFGGLALAALVSFYCTFCWQSRTAIGLVVLLVAATVGALLPWTGLPAPDDHRLVLLATCMMSAAVSGSVIVLRIAGYRLERIDRSQDPVPSAEE